MSDELPSITKPPDGHRGWNLGMVVTAIVVGAILWVMISFLGAFLQREIYTHGGRTGQGICANNLHLIGIACVLYSQDFSGAYPFAANADNSNDHFYLLLDKYKVSRAVFVCPFDFRCRIAAKDLTAAAFDSDAVSYAYIAGLKASSRSDQPLAGDNLKDPSKANDISYQQYQVTKVCSQGGGNHGKTPYGLLSSCVLFVDGHVETNRGSRRSMLEIPWKDATGGTANIKNPNGIKDGS